MKRKFIGVVAGCALLAGCVTPYGAHMEAPGYPHVGYYDGTLGPNRLATWYDETESSEWIAAEQTAHDNWANVDKLYNSDGHNLPYLDFHLTGGHPGCDNEQYGFDVCENGVYPRRNADGSQTLAITSLSTDSQSHILYASITVGSPFSYSPAERVTIMCHETGHVLGLAHNTANPGSCMQAYIPPSWPQTLGSDDIQELLKFYDGHTE